MLIERLDYALTAGNALNPHNRKYTLLRSYVFLYRTKVINIPKGYVWDGPSGLPLIPLSAKKWLEPSLQHDFIYFNKGEMQNCIISREEADEVFLKGLSDNKVNAVFIWLIRTFMKKAFQKVWESETGAVKLSTLGKILWPMFAFILMVVTSSISSIVAYLR